MNSQSYAEEIIAILWFILATQVESKTLRALCIGLGIISIIFSLYYACTN